MIEPHGSHKITAGHLARKAIVYLRQSSLKQVRENLLSQRLQYALADRARELGFERVDVVDKRSGCERLFGVGRARGFRPSGGVRSDGRGGDGHWPGVVTFGAHRQGLGVSGLRYLDW